MDRLHCPSGVAVDSSGSFVYVADTGNHRIQKFALSSTIASMTKIGVFRNNHDWYLITMETERGMAMESIVSMHLARLVISR